MKQITLTPLFLAAALLLCFSQELRSESLGIKATLILGSQDGKGVDGQLKQYQSSLKRHFPFDTFRQVGSSSARMELPGGATARLPNGHAVSFEAKAAGKGKFRLSARWTISGRTAQNTTVLTQKGSPTALAGPKQGDGTLILLLVPH